MAVLLTSLLWAALAAAPSPVRCPTHEAAAVELGNADAPLRLSAYVDPASTSAATTWTELQRIVAEHGDGLAIAVWFVRPPQAYDPRIERVRRLALAAVRLGRVREALALVARRGPEFVAVALADESRHDGLARALAVERRALDDALTRRCDAARVDDASAMAAELARRSTLGALRLPAFVVGTFVFDDGPGLDRVRAELAREPVRSALRWRIEAEPAGAPPIRGTSETMRVPPPGGADLGGVGLPHRLVVVAQGEDDPNLFLTLPRALQFRAAHPGVLSVHVRAIGRSFVATQLRQRLCAARLGGRELDYLRALAAAPDVRREPDEALVELMRALDAIADRDCGDADEPPATGLAEGAWLDGIPRSAAELDDLTSLVRQGQRARRPLSLWTAIPAGEAP